MPKQLSLSKRLSTLKLLDRYRNASNVIEKSHYQIIWLLSTGKTPKQVAEITSYTQTWIYQLINRYNEKAEKGLGDLRASNPGKEPLTNEVIANHSPRSLCELEEPLVVRCRKLLQEHNLIKGLTCYHWWPRTRAF